MIDWDELLIAIPLALPEAIAAAVAIGLLLRRPERPNLWLLAPIAVLGFSALVRFMPIFIQPVEQWLDSIASPIWGVLVAWFGDMLLRSLAWAALLYGIFWKLPAKDLPPLDPVATRTAVTAALLAVMLSESESSERQA